MPLQSVHLPAIVWAALSAVLLWTPARELPQTGVDASIADPLAHLGLFAVQAILARRSLRALRPHRPAAAFTLALCGLWGLVLELGQIPVAGRGWEAADVAVNLLGAALGLVLTRLAARCWLYFRPFEGDDREPPS